MTYVTLQDVSLESSYSAQVGPNSIGGDKLRKAIERNRSRQARRSNTRSQVVEPETSRFTAGTVGSRVTRKRVARADDIEFIETRPRAKRTTRKKATRRNTSKLSYFKNFSQKSFSEVLVFLGWGFNVFLIFRLVFAMGGLIDYYQMDEVLKGLDTKKERLLVENKNLTHEIHQIMTNSKMQKRLAREHLGVISRDEYLILFSQ